MTNWKGTTSTSASSTVYAIPIEIPYFFLVNSSASTATINIYIISGSTLYKISPEDMQLVAGQAYEVVAPYYLKAGETLYITTDQEIYYYATINPTI